MAAAVTAKPTRAPKSGSPARSAARPAAKAPHGDATSGAFGWIAVAVENSSSCGAEPALLFQLFQPYSRRSRPEKVQVLRRAEVHADDSSGGELGPPGDPHHHAPVILQVDHPDPRAHRQR